MCPAQRHNRDGGGTGHSDHDIYMQSYKRHSHDSLETFVCITHDSREILVLMSDDSLETVVRVLRKSRDIRAMVWIRSFEYSLAFFSPLSRENVLFISQSITFVSHIPRILRIAETKLRCEVRRVHDTCNDLVIILRGFFRIKSWVRLQFVNNARSLRSHVNAFQRFSLRLVSKQPQTRCT